MTVKANKTTARKRVRKPLAAVKPPVVETPPPTVSPVPPQNGQELPDNEEQLAVMVYSISVQEAECRTFREAVDSRLVFLGMQRVKAAEKLDQIRGKRNA